MKINCIAVDDEPIGLMKIVDYIKSIPFFNLLAQCENVFEVIEEMKNNKVHLIFIDINMPEVTGIDFVKTLPKDVKFIFTTAYSQYAIESYKLNALDYLLKPIDYDDFINSSIKIKEYFSHYNLLTDSSEKNTQFETEFFFVKTEGTNKKVFYDDINFIEGANEYIIIHLTDNRKVRTYLRLKFIEGYLPKNKFNRVHRSFIINLTKFKHIENNSITFNNLTKVPVSKKHKVEILKYIANNQIK